MEQGASATSAPSGKWTARQKPNSKRAVLPPTSDNYNDWNMDQLKLECTARKLSVAKNTKKEERVAILDMYDGSKGGVALLLDKQRLGKRSKTSTDTDEARRSRHCMFRLINVLFSHEFFQRFIASGDQLTRKQLDEGGSRFWAEVAAAFNTPNDVYDRLVNNDSLFDGICPDQITVHSAAKLRAMWKEVHSNFSKAEARNKLSGTHAEFWNFCQGDKAVMYLNLWCDERGEGREFCSSCVYKDNEDDSTQESTTTSTTPTQNRKRRKSVDPIASLADTLKTLVESETGKKSDLIAEQTALARVQREHIERGGLADKMAAVDAILTRYRSALRVVEEQIHSRNSQGIPTQSLIEEEERLRNRITRLQEKADLLEDAIVDS